MKDPAFLFYSSDFLSGVQDLTMEERGQYITLLCLQHQKGHLTEKMIRLCCGNATADVMAKFTQDDEGNFFNYRLDIEIEKRKLHSDKQRKRAIDGWEKRKNNAVACATAYDTANAAALPLENENRDRNIFNDIDILNLKEEEEKKRKKEKKKKKEKIDIVLSFDEFWQMYGKSVGNKIKLSEKYYNLKIEDIEKIKIHIPKYRLAQPDKKYRKNPETYLNNRSWNDEIISDKPQAEEKELTDFELLNLYHIPHGDLFGYPQNILVERVKQGLYTRKA